MNPVAVKLYEKATTCNNHTVSLTLRAVADAIVEVEKETLAEQEENNPVVEPKQE